jgi:hypothetical protein
MVKVSEPAIKEKLAKGYLKVDTVLEIAGSPKEHVEETFRLVLKKLKEEKNIDVLNGKVHEPKPQGAFFSAFAELTLLIKDFPALVSMSFDYTPSSIEIIEPEELKLSPTGVSDLFNDVLGKLHEIDMQLKNSNAANTLLTQNLNNMLKNSVLILLNSGPMAMGELSQKVGIIEKQLEPFLDRFVKEGLIRKQGHNYAVM